MNAVFDGHTDEYTHVVFERPCGTEQYRLTVSNFKGKEYIGIRKYVYVFEEEWIPTREGVTMPYDLDTCLGLFSALTTLLSKAEVLEEVVAHIPEAKELLCKLNKALDD